MLCIVVVIRGHCEPEEASNTFSTTENSIEDSVLGLEISSGNVLLDALFRFPETRRFTWYNCIGVQDEANVLMSSEK